jgi:hypothetical protein
MAYYAAVATIEGPGEKAARFLACGARQTGEAQPHERMGCIMRLAGRRSDRGLSHSTWVSFAPE